MSEPAEAEAASGLSIEFGPAFSETERDHALDALEEAGFPVEDFDVRHRGAEAGAGR
ncbi:hypothetical protein U4E84_09590 [Halorubrum sp. AD140]|uniref:hypothetical protein n=1 Tax=Halorubrum sp. AD140 TaxID=3050073 RepID=UPI002ACCB8D1|nr:hypothetical protein [Halorubrum sp. AD140]MDZ5811595.1 hypothetical protein [Halorubrum sp. AD140]